MAADSPIDDKLLSAIEAGSLDESTSQDTELVATFAAHQKLEAMFALLRQPTPTAFPEQPPPSTVGRYLIRKEIGRGAFGVVYLADDPELKRPVAIKTQRHQSFSSAAGAEAFLNEAWLAAQLKHPGIVPVHDVGRDAEQCYIVMSFIEGRTLEDLLRSERLPPRRAAELVAQVADAIHYAHGRGLYHRDLKPANILVDAAGNAHVSDFGLAVTEDNQRLFANQVAGTPAYMSPEQIRGEAHFVDGRTDIWSLGVILYEMLTGRHPFWKGTVADCLDEIQHREPRPPRQIDDTIPVALESIALRCMAKTITDRFNTAADVADALRTCVRERRKRRVPRGTQSQEKLSTQVSVSTAPTSVTPTPKSENRVYIVLRWLACTPAAVAAGILAHLIVLLLNRWSLAFHFWNPDSVFGKLICLTFSSAAMGFVAVHVAIAVAPTQKRTVAVVAAGGILFLSGLSSYPVLLDGDWWAAYQLVLTNVAAVGAGYSFFKAESQPFVT